MRKYGRQIPALVLALVLALTPAGCGVKPARQWQCVTPLTCLHPASIPELLVPEEGKLFSCWADYAQNVTHLDVVDVERDEVVTSVTVEGTMEPAQDTLSGGKVVLRSQDDGLLYLWDTDSAQMDTMTVPATDGILSHDGRTYYYIDQQVLCTMDTATGDASILPLAQPLRFSAVNGLHPTEEWLSLTVYTSPYTLTVGTAVVDADDGTIRLLQNSTWDVSYSGSAPSLTGVDTQTLTPRAVFSTPDAPNDFYGLTATSSGGDTEWCALPRSPYLIGVTSADDGETTTLCRLAQRVQACALSDCSFDSGLRGCVYLTAEDLIAGSVYKDGVCTLYLLAPSLLPFAELGVAERLSFTPVDEGMAADYPASQQGMPVSQALSDVRRQADTLEQRFGVHIFISSQCAALCRLSGREVTTSDQAGLTDEAGDIARTLNTLEERLGQYPEGFFRQFSTAYGDGGVCFLLTGSVNDDIGTVGFAFEAGLYQCIALDITLGDAGGTVCHEIWHATENYITGQDSTVFDETSWCTYNPDGFSYYPDYPDQPESGRWTLYGVTGEAVYFVDDYARTDSHEDRARIMEYIMLDDFTARAVMDAPVLREKLQMLCRAVRTYFDTNAWDNVRWERFF